MTGPAEVVFEGVLAPELLGLEAIPPDPGSGEAELGATPEPSLEATSAASAAAAAADIECATACVQGCVRPEACASAEARARVAALLEGRSLDELVALATAAAAERAGRPAGGNG
jgi:diaminopimelate epimerase